uniref:Uncharacterized protein n=2 Tax=Meloidogyne TaxID=189290 RepID=A0A6V7UCS8_MELEN|nr:unnamed protein product [Meloidogyne enterolobii]
MNFRQPYFIALFIYQLSFLADFVVGEGPSKNATGQVSCYVCNSDNEGQKDCESTDLDKLKPFLKPCPVLPDGPLVGRPAESCRKVLQQVEFGKTEINNVVRECGYNTEVLDGKRRAGNSGINLKIWQCINTDNNNPCNSALNSNMNTFLALIIGFVVVTVFSRL